ncbi:M56 family metallopeptidase [Paenibacillus alvei]|uniref:M56 family metallopeptidase n=1 Tax=Paenibacillus alvei TaxID=44250 RepID=UPI002280F098|nr:M56 family metallopeptidase [Paenibacillus alvei]
MKLIETLFYLVLTASLASTVIILPLLLTRKLLTNRLGPRIFHVLWMLVLIKLLVPIAPQSPVSLFNLIPHDINWPTWTTEQPISSENKMEPSLTVNDSESTTNVNPAPIPKQTEESSSIVNPLLHPYTYEEEQDHPNKMLTTGSMVWIAGILSLSTYYLFVVLRFNKRVGVSCKLENHEVLSILENCKKKLGITKTIPIYETTRLHSPCIYGLTKPRIYLPADIITIADSRQLMHIILHELTHYKRADLWFNFLWTLAAVFHWFNPVVWLSMKKIKADREVACDAGVLEMLDEHESSSYGMTLLMLSRLFTRTSSPQVNLSNFFANNREMKRRITMISKFRKGKYKLSAATIILLLGLGAVMLTNSSEHANGAESGSKQESSRSTFKIQGLMYWVKWFNNLERANDFVGFLYKVPDYLPEGYQLSSIDVDGKHESRKDDKVTINFSSNYGKVNDTQFEVIASTGNIMDGTLSQRLEGGRTTKIPGPSWGEALPQTYIQDEVTYADIRGILVTTVQKYEHHEPEIEKTFFWRDEGIYYAIQFYSEDHTVKEGIPRNRRTISQDELEKILKSFTYPQHIQHVSYDGEGNSFPIYEEKDLQVAEKLLGFKVKFPLTLSNNKLKLTNSRMLQAGDRNTGYSFRPTVDSVWNIYSAADDSQKSNFAVYQSKLPLMNGTQLTLIRELNMDGIGISVYKDDNYVYGGPYYNNEKIISETYYIWKQHDIYYTAYFDDNLTKERQEELLKTFILAPR